MTWAKPRNEKRSGMDVPAQVVESGPKAATSPAMLRSRLAGLGWRFEYNGARGAMRPTFPSRAASAASSSSADSAHRKRSSVQDGWPATGPFERGGGSDARAVAKGQPSARIRTATPGCPVPGMACVSTRRA